MNEFELDNNDVVSISSGKNFAKTGTCRFLELKQAIEEYMRPNYEQWVGRGVESQVLLQTGGGWQRGKFRLRLEFIPDPEEPPQS